MQSNAFSQLFLTENKRLKKCQREGEIEPKRDHRWNDRNGVKKQKKLFELLHTIRNEKKEKIIRRKTERPKIKTWAHRRKNEFLWLYFSLISFLSRSLHIFLSSLHISLALSWYLTLCPLHIFRLWFSRSIPLVYYYYLFMLLHRIHFIPVSIYLFQRVFVGVCEWVRFLFIPFGGTTPMFSNSILNFCIPFLAYLFSPSVSVSVFTAAFFGLCIQVIWVFVLHLLVTRFAQNFSFSSNIHRSRHWSRAKEEHEKVKDIGWSKEARPDQ